MPEIRLGAGENLVNVNLGSVIIEEIRLGDILVWQNNQGPIYGSVVWDGTAFTVPTPGDAFSFPAVSGAASPTGPRTISIVVNNLSDPDNVMVPTDFIVGYRLQRPDGSWAAGNPNEMIPPVLRADLAPAADFGDVLPGTVSTFDPITGEFTAGALTVATTTIPVTLRDDDTAMNIVDSMAGANSMFRDNGQWELFAVDSRGGESSMGTIDVTLNYATPVNVLMAQGTDNANPPVNVGANIAALSTAIATPTSITNATVAGPDNITLRSVLSAGPLSTTIANQYNWTCVSGCVGGPFTTETINVPVPQDAAGNATPARWRLQTTGRAWAGNAAPTSATVDAVFRSGPSCAPTLPAMGNTSFGFNPGTAAVCATLVMAPTTYTKTCSPAAQCGAFNAGANNNRDYSQPNPGCTAPATRERATVSISGQTVGLVLTASGSRTFQGSYPQVASTCTVTVNCNNAPTALDPRCGTTVAGVVTNCAGTTCAGGTATTPCNSPNLNIANNNGANYRGGGSTNGTACSAPGGTSTLTVNYTAIQPEWGITCGAMTVPAGTAQGDVFAAAGCTVGITNGVSTNGFLANLFQQRTFGPAVCGPGDTYTVTGSIPGRGNPCVAVFFQGGCQTPNPNVRATVTCV